MKSLLSVTGGLLALLTITSASAQNATMMNGNMWGYGWMGGYGGYWLPILGLVVVVGLVVWIVKQQKRK